MAGEQLEPPTDGGNGGNEFDGVIAGVEEWARAWSERSPLIPALRQHILDGLTLSRGKNPAAAVRHFTDRERSKAMRVDVSVAKMVPDYLFDEEGIFGVVRLASYRCTYAAGSAGRWSITGAELWLSRELAQLETPEQTFAAYPSRYYPSLVKETQRQLAISNAEPWLGVLRQLQGGPFMQENESADIAAVLYDYVPLSREFLTRTYKRMEWCIEEHPERAMELHRFCQASEWGYPPAS
jgi:hypothetical protein